jgi:nucleoside-diphosphate-sugar epimerase
MSNRMTSALIGHSGFVGGNLADQHAFDAFFNSKNIEEITGQHFELLVISAMPAAKWLANRDPASDRATLDRLVGCLRRSEARQVVLISTVDVYPSPILVNEDSSIDPEAQQPYGRHRYRLEREVSAHFRKVLIARLPALFGPGLKKNAIYDLLHDNEVHKIHSQGSFQFYNVERLWADLQTALTAELHLINFATEPLTMARIAREAFDRSFENDPDSAPARYDMRSKYAALYGGSGGYLFRAEGILSEIRGFVMSKRAHRA